MNTLKIITTKEKSKIIIEFALSLSDNIPIYLKYKDISEFTVTDWKVSLAKEISSYADKNNLNQLLTITADSIKNLAQNEVGLKNTSLCIICIYVLHSLDKFEHIFNPPPLNVTQLNISNKILLIQETLAIIESKNGPSSLPPHEDQILKSDMVDGNNADVKSHPKKERKTEPIYKSIGLLTVIGLLIMSVIWHFKNKEHISQDYENIKISFSPSSLNDTSNTLTINYDISQIKYISASIDFGNDTPIRDITQSKGNIQHTFTMGAGREIKLKIDTFVKTYYIPIFSEKNIAFVQYYKWEILDNSLYKNGIFHIPISKVPQSFLESGSFMTGIHKVKNFNINGDDMTFKTRVRNFAKNGGLPAYDIAIDINGIAAPYHKGVLSFNLLDSNFLKYIKVTAGETKEGTFNENGVDKFYHPQSPLEYLTINTQEWLTVKVITQNNLLKIFINNQLRHEINYTGKIGKVTFIQLGFLGSGEVDWYEIKDNISTISFREDFNL